MLRTLRPMIGYTLAARDGDLGKINDVLFDDASWNVRYFVVDTGGWLAGRRVLISPHVVGRPDAETKHLPVNLTKDQVQHSPDVSVDPPVSFQHLTPLHSYYGWPLWWGVAYVPPPIPQDELQPRPGDPHLRGIKEVHGYHLHAPDGEIGHVEDMIAELDAWMIRYLIVDTKNWLRGRRVLISPDWIEHIGWAAREVKVSMPRAAIENSPEFDPSAPVNREYEVRLYDYYGRPVGHLPGAGEER
jgi:uncharacterized protein YrrD